MKLSSSDISVADELGPDIFYWKINTITNMIKKKGYASELLRKLLLIVA